MTDLHTGVVELTRPERDSLARYEKTIERGLNTFVEVGNALVQIRDQRLYRADYATFEQYALDRWGLSETSAYRTIDAATVHNLISSPIGEEINKAAPHNEAQARPLARLLPEPTARVVEREEAHQRIRDTWAEAVKTAPTGTNGQPKVTAKHVEETVARMEDKPMPPPPLQPAPGPRKAAPRRPLIDAFRDITYDLIKVIERADRLVCDDRYPRNAEQVALVCRGDLLRAADLLAAVIDRVPTSKEEGTKCH